MDMCTLNFLGLVLAYTMRSTGKMPLVSTPPIGGELGDTKRFQ
jgi:hypothetical protein